MSVHNFVIEKGSTDVTLDVSIQDSTDGTPLTALVYNSSGLTCYYKRGTTGAATALTLATTTATGAHTDGGFVLVSDTNFEGVYKLDLSDAIVATGEDRVTIVLRGVTNMMPTTINIDLTDPINVTSGIVQANVKQVSDDTTAADNLELACDNYSVTRGLTGTALPAAAADAAGGVPISDAGGLDLDAILALLDDARTEPAQGAPPVNPDAMTKIDYLYKAWRNKTEQTATTLSLYDDAGTTVDQKSTVSDNGTTATKGEIVTGP